ncbi:MAG: succinate dehydrogenase, cytochrome b556 subunit [Pseudomonadota bacterium]
MAQAETSGADPRPTSPHLQIYTFRINMVMSILHRITGVALYFGTVLLATWLIAAAVGGEAYETVSWLFGSWIGLLVLFGYTWVLLHHMMGGVRHFIWDTGSGFDLETVDRLCWASLAVSVGGTLMIWAVALLA